MPINRRPRPIERTPQTVRDARLMVIASEGEKTESRYFTIFRSTRLQIRLIPSADGKSSPEHVFQNLLEYSREFDLGEGDQMWLVIDRDDWDKASLSTVAQQLHAKGWNLALSNPCFELWLALHFEEDLPNPTSAATLRRYLQAALGGYNKSRFDPAVFLPRVRAAEERARSLDTIPEDRWPQGVATRVYQITEQFI